MPAGRCEANTPHVGELAFQRAVGPQDDSVQARTQPELTGFLLAEMLVVTR